METKKEMQRVRVFYLCFSKKKNTECNLFVVWFVKVALFAGKHEHRNRTLQLKIEVLEGVMHRFNIKSVDGAAIKIFYSLLIFSAKKITIVFLTYMIHAVTVTVT